MYKILLQPILFLFDAEKVHRFVFKSIRFFMKIPLMKSWARSTYQIKDTKLEKELFGIKFPNPIGLAAGFDKNAELIDEFACLGFGFLEIGTITPKGQAGNPKPRLFRLKSDKALINRMGFNNEGMEIAIEKLKKRKSNIIIGGNIGKNKVTPNEKAVEDYKKCFETLFDYVDYFVVNVSSPNTPNLRALQDKEPLENLLNTLQKLNKAKEKPKPILLKIAPDLTNPQLDEIIEVVQNTQIAGLIATNTTIERSNLHTTKDKIQKIGAGGLSGHPLKQRSTEVIRYLKSSSKNAFPIIGVGGIASAQDALEKIEAGADLLQVYTGFVYEGPKLIKKINRAFLKQEKY